MKTTKRTKKTKKSEMLLELDGRVCLIERTPGKPDIREEIDGKLVLECLVKVISMSLDAFEKKGSRR